MWHPSLRTARQQLLSASAHVVVALSAWALTSDCARGLPDEVVRVLDANAVKLRKAGVVRLAGETTPASGLPECFRFTPSAHLRRALPPRTAVDVEVVAKGRAFIKRVATGDTTVNEALVGGGWAKANPYPSSSDVVDGRYEKLVKLQMSARARHVGIWQLCDVEGLVPQFDDLTQPSGQHMEVAARPASSRCGDYAYFEQAKEVFDSNPQRFASLDSDGDGIPCGGLPHRPEIERRQLKMPAGRGPTP